MDPAEFPRFLRESVEGLQDVIKDLQYWEKITQTQDEALMKNEQTNSRQVQPIRSSKPDRKVNTRPEPKVAKAAKRGTDYGAWEKFDVEDECAKLDSVSTRKPDKATESDKLVAVFNKRRGNEFFNRGQLDRAIQWYTEGMKRDDTNAALFANRSMAYLKKGLFAESERDCNDALALDPSYTKVYQRRASARMAQGKLELAKEDLRMVLDMMPGSRQAKEELHYVTALLKACGDNSGECESLRPVMKPEHLRSKKPMKEIPVVEVSPEEKVSRPLQPDRPREPATVPRKDIEVPAIPKTAFQFRSDWRLLGDHRDLFYEYLSRIPPSSYRQLFRHSLESNVLSEMLRTYRDFYMRDGLDVKGPMEALASTARFSTLVMFMSEDDKKVTRELLLHLRGTVDNIKEVEDLVNKYELKL